MSCGLNETLSQKNKVEGAGEGGSSLKCLPHKPKDLSSDPKPSHKCWKGMLLGGWVEIDPWGKLVN